MAQYCCRWSPCMTRSQFHWHHHSPQLPSCTLQSESLLYQCCEQTVWSWAFSFEDKKRKQLRAGRADALLFASVVCVWLLITDQKPVATLQNELWPNSHWSEWWCRYRYTGGNTVWPASHRISISIDQNHCTCLIHYTVAETINNWTHDNYNLLVQVKVK